MSWLMPFHKCHWCCPYYISKSILIYVHAGKNYKIYVAMEWSVVLLSYLPRQYTFHVGGPFSQEVQTLHPMRVVWDHKSKIHLKCRKCIWYSSQSMCIQIQILWYCLSSDDICLSLRHLYTYAYASKQINIIYRKIRKTYFENTRALLHLKFKMWQKSFKKHPYRKSFTSPYYMTWPHMTVLLPCHQS